MTCIFIDFRATVGDRQIERVLNVYERIQRELPRKDPRNRIEHCTLVNDSLVQKMRELHVIPVPISGYVYYHRENCISMVRTGCGTCLPFSRRGSGPPTLPTTLPARSIP